LCITLQSVLLYGMDEQRKKDLKEEYRLRHVSILNYIEGLTGVRPAKSDMDFWPSGPCFLHWGFATLRVKAKLREKGFDV